MPAHGKELAPDGAEFVGVLLESTLYGLYLACFPATLFVLWNHDRSGSGSRRHGGGVNKILFGSSVLLFLWVSAHAIINMVMAYEAFITHREERHGKLSGPLYYYAQYNDPLNVAKHVFLTLEIITLDALLLYRVYVIWRGQLWVTILPSLTLLGSAATGFYVCFDLSRISYRADVYGSATGKWITSAFSLSLATNLLAVSLIAYRILSHGLANRALGARSLSTVVIIIVESAALACVANLIILASYLNHSNAMTTAHSVSSSISGIACSLIILRVGLRKSLIHVMGVSAPERSPQSGAFVAATRSRTQSESHSTGPIYMMKSVGDGSETSTAPTSDVKTRQESEWV